MGENTAIEWADHTINFYLGCTKVSPGCQNCYMFRNLSYTRWNPNVVTKVNFENVKKKLKSWRSAIVFTNSMSDTFHESLSFDDIKAMFDIMATNPDHQFIILTKRVNKAYNYFKKYPCPDNCWIGTSIENRCSLHRLAKLKMIKARIKFLSLEPLLERLGDVDMKGLQWVIVGGESDLKAPRFFDVDWAKDILEQCRKFDIPFFFKQTGGTRKIDGCWGSNLIDGHKYLEMPIALKTKPSVARVETKGLSQWT